MIVWNHPGLRSNKPAITTWFDIHSWLYNTGILKGIEVYNHDSYYEKTFQWALEKNLTVFANTDNHYAIRRNYDLVNSHRPMTLVFARERNLESVKEAFLEGRTAAFTENTVRGFEKWLLPLFHSCVKYTRKGDQIELVNNSGISFKLEQPGDSAVITLKEKGTATIPSKNRLLLRVKNFEVAPGKNLEITIE